MAKSTAAGNERSDVKSFLDETTVATLGSRMAMLIRRRSPCPTAPHQTAAAAQNINPANGGGQTPNYEGEIGRGIGTVRVLTVEGEIGGDWPLKDGSVAIR
jgi:hypothetical protein